MNTSSKPIDLGAISSTPAFGHNPRIIRGFRRLDNGHYHATLEPPLSIEIGAREAAITGSSPGTETRILATARYDEPTILGNLQIAGRIAAIMRHHYFQELDLILRTKTFRIRDYDWNFGAIANAYLINTHTEDASFAMRLGPRYQLWLNVELPRLRELACLDFPVWPLCELWIPAKRIIVWTTSARHLTHRERATAEAYPNIGKTPLNFNANPNP